MSKSIVIDSNLFIKQFIEEEDSSDVRVFFKTSAETNTGLLVPELFKYEIVQITVKKNQSLDNTLHLLHLHTDLNLQIVAPSKAVWLQAEKIAKQGHKNSGYPSIYDSVYHALAIESDAIFLTADKRHYAKAKSFGNIKLFRDWESIFI